MGGAPSTLLSSPALLLGGVEPIRGGSDFLEANKIAAVVSVCDECPVPREGLEVLHIDLEDVPGTEVLPLFGQVAEFIHAARCSGGAVYVHCTAGISRSSTVAAGYLMASLGLSRAEALGHIHRCRETACPNEGFLRQLAEFEGALAAAVRERLDTLGLAGAKLRREADLCAVADSLRAAEEAAQAHAAAQWFYRADGGIVPAELVLRIHDPDDGNGPRVWDPERPYTGLVRPRGGDEFGEGVPSNNWGLDDFEAQKERLRELLQPQIDVGRTAGGSVGLEWLLPEWSPETTTEIQY